MPKNRITKSKTAEEAKLPVFQVSDEEARARLDEMDKLLKEIELRMKRLTEIVTPVIDPINAKLTEINPDEAEQVRLASTLNGHDEMMSGVFAGINHAERLTSIRPRLRWLRRNFERVNAISQRDRCGEYMMHEIGGFMTGFMALQQQARQVGKTKPKAKANKRK